MGKPGAWNIFPNNHQAMESEPVGFDKQDAVQEAFTLVGYLLWLGFVKEGWHPLSEIDPTIVSFLDLIPAVGH